MSTFIGRMPNSDAPVRRFNLAMCGGCGVGRACSVVLSAREDHKLFIEDHERDCGGRVVVREGSAYSLEQAGEKAQNIAETLRAARLAGLELPQ